MSKTPKEIINEVNRELQEKGVVTGLSLGSIAPEFSLQDQDGCSVSLSQILGSGFIILSFYRGDWCGYCRKELVALQEIYTSVKSLNAEIIGISPQTPKEAKKLSLKLGISFPLLSDIYQNVIQDYNLHFEVHKRIQEVYQSKFKLNLPELTANETWELPVPATYILNKNGSIVKKFVQMDYTQRMDVKEILFFLEENLDKMHY